VTRVHVPERDVRYVDANGLRFAYLEEGEGPLVLLFHGFPDTAHTWDATRPVLAAAGFRAVSPFLRGYAPSGIPERDTTAHARGRDVLALIDALGGGAPAILVGHDWGSDCVYAATNLAPERVRKLVTVAIPYPPGVTPTPRLAWAVRHFAVFKLPGTVRRFVRDDFAMVDVMVRRWSPTWDYAPEELEPVKNAFAAPGCLNAALGYYRALWWPPPELSGDIAVPTLAIAGADDPNVGVSAYEEARRKHTGPYRVEAIGGGHFCHRESPDAFHRALLAFLGPP